MLRRMRNIRSTALLDIFDAMLASLVALGIYLRSILLASSRQSRHNHAGDSFRAQHRVVTSLASVSSCLCSCFVMSLTFHV